MKTNVTPHKKYTKLGKPRKQRELSPKQRELLDLVRANPGKNTSQLRRLLPEEHSQGYESLLRDRLLRLVEHKYVTYKEEKNIDGTVRCRLWYA